MVEDAPEPDSAGARGRRGDYVVCAEEELPPGSVVVVPVGKFGVGVYNVDGRFYALTNYCPHEGGPLCLGRIQGTTEPSPILPDRVRYVRDGAVVRCPWHSWEFDITTGKCVGDPARGIRAYEVQVEKGQVILKQ
jgi:nitrite reductase/ring-hydroxylating ferredoxin subunit